jgi:hypothetical protein
MNLDLLGDPPHRKLSRGYAGTPGLGPQGETCGSCRHCLSKRRVRRYFKCQHPLGYVSHGKDSDIRRSTAACEYWTARTKR